MSNPRAVAAQTLQRVVQSQASLTASLVIARKKCRTHEERALVQELCFGVLRFYFRLTAIAERLLHSPLRANDQDVFFLLLIGLYQLTEQNIPTYAAVSETVNATRALKKVWAKGLINKILRLFLSQKNNFDHSTHQSLMVRYAHPEWFIEKIKTAWPNDWESILLANNTHPPMTIRVNTTKVTRDAYLTLLREHDIEAEAIADLPEAIQLKKPLPVFELPKFDAGWCYVQDAAGQFAAHLLALKPEFSVLDACAAPGSKTTHILELCPTLKKLTAIDNDPLRLQLIKENIDRLNLNKTHLRLILADAAETKQWATNEGFDRILLDAPCSASGILRRHPDIKILRKASDISQYQEKQYHLLHALWPLLKPEGLLLYSTCSIFPDENETIIHDFLSTHRDAKISDITVAGARTGTYGKQILPTANGMDGFYYARLIKVSATN